MQKNITVTDVQGRIYQPTWPKRAKGLVKRGRAAFVDDHTICLTQPPHIHMEDQEMNIQDILNLIHELSQDHSHISDAIEGLKSIQDPYDPSCCGAPPNVAGAAKADAIAQIVTAKETTRQQLLSFYISVYHDMMKGKQPSALPQLTELPAPEQFDAADMPE